MSAILLGAAMAAHVPSRTAKLVLIKLVDCCDDEGRRIFPSLATLARAGCCSEQQARRVLALFCEVGLLRRLRDGGKGPGSTGYYEMDVALLKRLSQGWPEGWRTAFKTAPKAPASGGGQAGDDAAQHAPDACDDDEADQSHAEKKDDMVSPLGAAERDVRLTPERDKGDMMGYPTPQEEPLNLRERARADAGRQAGAPAGAVKLSTAEASGTPTLDQFRKRWPTTVADDAIRVENAWAALSFADRRAAFEAVPAFLDEMKALKRAIPPAGFTYLAQRRWQGLEGRKAAMAATTTHLEIKPLGKDWWAVLLDRSERGQRIGMMLSMAAEGKSYWVTLSEFPARLRDRLKATPAGSAHAAAWMGWLKARGHRPPELKADAWVFLPEGEPPAMAQGIVGVVGGVGVDGKEADLRGAAF
jgi:hypothetical protein